MKLPVKVSSVGDVIDADNRLIFVIASNAPAGLAAKIVEFINREYVKENGNV